MTTTTELPVLELREGDRFEHDGTHHYTVWAPPLRLAATGEVIVPVQYADGGIGQRVFDADRTLSVVRP